MVLKKGALIGRRWRFYSERKSALHTDQEEPTEPTTTETYEATTSSRVGSLPSLYFIGTS
jgi:hypothetical protein